MACRFIDLHMHTTLSDGLATPSQVLSKVRRADITAFSITDHDTLAGYRAVKELLEPGDPELISGLELSVQYGEHDLHMLAYLFDPENETLNEALNLFQARRNNRGRVIVRKLNEMGYDFPYEAVEETAGEAAVGRPHIAQTMAELNLVKSYQQAFDDLIGNGKPAYVPKKNFTPKEAIKTIHAAGGVAVLAHPQIDETYYHIEMLMGLGLDGIEIYHPSHQQRHTDQFRHLAKRHRLAVSGGSDFHGRESRHGAIGSQRVPEECLEQLRRRAQLRKDRV